MSEGFLSRWSRRKVEAKQEDAVVSEEIVAPPTDAPEAPQDGAEPWSEEELAELERAAEEVTEETGVQRFLDPRVPQAIRNIALRRLWRSNPVFACLDGLNDYEEDYTDAAVVIAGMKSAYRVGKGFLTDLDRLGMGMIDEDEYERETGLKAPGREDAPIEVASAEECDLGSDESADTAVAEDMDASDETKG